MTARALLAGLLLMAGPTWGHAQGAPADSAVVVTIMRGVYGRLGDQLAVATKDTTHRAWEISPPAADSARWMRHRAELGRVLRARAATADDGAIQTLEWRDIALTADTLTLRVIVGLKRRCKDGSWGGYWNIYSLVAVRSGTTWEEPRVVRHMIGDSFCFDELRGGGSER